MRIALFKLLLPFLLTYFSCYSQKITNVEFTVSQDNNLLVTYDLETCPSKQFYDIKIEVLTDNNSIEAKSISGDIKNVSCGRHKQIVWDVLNDKSELKGNIRVVVKIVSTHSTKITGGPSNAFLSMLLPGVGDYYVNRPSKKWYYISLAYLGSAYLAYSYKSTSNQFYDQYHKATTQQEMDQAYTSANDNYQIYQFMVGLTASIWLVDVVYVTVRGFKNRKEQLSSYSYINRSRMFLTASQGGFRVGYLMKF